MALEVSYRQAAASLPRGVDPTDYVVIAADWTRRVTRDHGASGAHLVPVVLVVGRDGEVVGRRSGANPTATLELLEQTLELLEQPDARERALHNGGAGRTLGLNLGAVAQIGRAPPLHGGGRGFESPRLHTRDVGICRINLRICRVVLPPSS